MTSRFYGLATNPQQLVSGLQDHAIPAADAPTMIYLHATAVWLQGTRDWMVNSGQCQPAATRAAGRLR
ncbi:hypothetical protein BLA24_07970 [Streptomyces cinnamoneus]|uniref:Uncharacterized protein n=1 Tax=Streptomyces cinnamoneus TaxID=53446 RepID=A0A2G1XMD2_STRCJ|nr:hypothetical protein [Streptomyces cinnamoneus]PHQ52376.1 hypothetical protein BLA24_07970 [Streptomyces cinnamoneus]PPT11578.1 hypothetical protein CYQ11_00405 [Streptomyces cinnamoneus]